MIHAYPREPSLRAGGSLILHTATTSLAFRVDFYRQGESLQHIASSDVLAGQAYPFGPVDADWGWPGYRFPIDESWKPGAYVAMLTEVRGAGDEVPPDATTADGESAKALFVVRPASGAEGRVLYKLPWNTYHAYNGTGDFSLYAQAKWSSRRGVSGFKVTTRRPGGGTGGTVMAGDSADAHWPVSRRQTFAHWDVPFIQWAERLGYPIDYCTDWDVHREPRLLFNYKLLLSVGHDEYWSDGMRDNVERYVESGGNVAFFSGNICCYRVHYVDDDTAMVCDKTVRSDLPGKNGKGDRWQQADPENSLTGVTYYRGGGWWDGRRDPVGYRIQHCEHWAFEGTDLKDSDVVGDAPDLPLVGYECDGADVVWRNGVAHATGRDGTPTTFVVLGTGELGPGWVTAGPGPLATMGTYSSPSGGTVFQAATTDWPMLLGRDPIVSRITANVIDRLRLPSVRIVGPVGPVRGTSVPEYRQAQLYVDQGRPFAGNPTRFCWTVRGKEVTVLDSEGPLANVVTGAGGQLMTVEVLVYDGDGSEIGFGSVTFCPLTEREALSAELCMLLSEMVMPGEPSAPLVEPEISVEELGRRLVQGNLPWIADRATRLAEIVQRLGRK